MSVLINGVEYVPAAASTGSKIGIGITTYNRNEQLTKTLTEWKKYSPGATIVVVDDASQKPVAEATYRFEQNVGIATAKNKCLELLYDAGCDHIFLADDDGYPLCEGWATPYIESPEPHLMYIFKDMAGMRTGHWKVVHEDDKHIAYIHTRGVVLYYERRVIDRVGGFDTVNFGKWGGEHIEYSDRIHHAGLTTYRYMDVIGSDKLIYSMDEHAAIAPTTTKQERQEADRNTASTLAAFRKQRRDEFLPFRNPTKNVVITHLWNEATDPQRRNVKMSMDEAKPLIDSVRGAEVVLFTNESNAEWSYKNTKLVTTEQPKNLFLDRHIRSMEYLRDNKDIKNVFCVDAGDVKMLNEPWQNVEAGKLYVGWEPQVVGCDWMKSVHTSERVKEFVRQNPLNQLYNAGVFGGDRDTVLEFLTDIKNVYADTFFETPEANDMGVFNLVAHNDKWCGRVVWGTQVTTVFKQEQTTGVSWWKHK